MEGNVLVYRTMQFNCTVPPLLDRTVPYTVPLV